MSDLDPRKLELDHVADHAWAMVSAGVDSARHAFHLPAIVTLGMHGADARTVVLRGADADQRTVWCHTDLRSPKVLEVRADPRVTWLFYDTEAKIQVRLRTMITLHTNDEWVEQGWENGARDSRQCYRRGFAPGDELGDRTFESAEDARSDDERQFLAVLQGTVHRIDWLFLRASGHRRAILDWSGKTWSPRWVVP